MHTIPKNDLRCIIVDDEVSSQNVLEHFISETQGLKLLETFSNAASAYEGLKTDSTIDLIFLDINMPRETGLDFYKRLINPPQVIFTTAYPQYAVEGFEVNATDYLLKPIAYDRFIKAIEKAFANSPSLPLKDFMIVSENKTLHKVSFESIDYIEAYGDYVKVHTENGIIVTHSTFSKCIETLPGFFMRVHKSYCINFNKVLQISGNTISLSNHNIPIGQTYRTTVMEHLKN